MTTHFSIKPRVVHLWRVWLPDWMDQIVTLRHLLAVDEIERADRFRFPIHRERFTIARALLRKTLCLYLDSAPEKITFSYGHRGKPYLQSNPTTLQFNVSHSHDMAVYAVTQEAEMGVDIEKIDPPFKEDVAKGFFSTEEYKALMQLPVAERSGAFYHIWSRKEAVIKALGEGLYAPLDTFSVSPRETIESIVLPQNSLSYHVESFLFHPEYQSAFATPQRVNETVCWQWSTMGPVFSLTNDKPIIEKKNKI